METGLKNKQNVIFLCNRHTVYDEMLLKLDFRNTVFTAFENG